MNIQPKMFLMSGLPGSGKSTLADEIAELYSAIVCSADDYFMDGDVYNFQIEHLGHAHAKCRSDAQSAVDEQFNVVVDNTNVSLKELKPYIDMALAANYRVYVVRPNTPWSKDVLKCHQRCTHNVPLATIERMDVSLRNLIKDERFDSPYKISVPTCKNYKVIHTIEEIESW